MNCLKIVISYTFLLLILLSCENSLASAVISNQEFIDIAAVRSASEVETAKIALERSNSANVKAYAQLVLDEQLNAIKGLRELAKAQHLQMCSDAELQAKARIFIFQRMGKDFDNAYADMRLVERKKSVSLFREAAEMAEGDIKQYAIHQLPILMRHLYMAQTLASDVAKTPAMVADNASHL